MMGTVLDVFNVCSRLQYIKGKTVMMEHTAMAAIIEIWRQRVKEI